MTTPQALDRRTLLRFSMLVGAGLVLTPPLRAFAETASPENWAGVTALIDKYIAAGALAGGVATIGLGNRPADVIARGREGFGDNDAMSANSLFRVYSMTKPITGMAAMMLIEGGKLRLDQAIADIFPQFARMRVAIDPMRSFKSVPARRPLTVRHLLTHTAGLAYPGIGTDVVSKRMLASGLTPAVVSHLNIPGLTPGRATVGPEAFISGVARLPLIAQPGTKWRYSIGLDVLGLVIQRVSGAASFGAFLQERMFGPLGMTSSYFRVPPAEIGRFTSNYGLTDGKPQPLDPADNSAFSDAAPFAFGGAGLVTTPADYDRFLAMIVGKGALGPVRLMREETMALATSNLLPPGTDTRGQFIEGAGFGAGGRVGLGPDQGTYGWSGAAGTVGFVNTRIGLRAGLYVQFMPPGAIPIQKEFPEVLRADLMKRAAR